MDQQIDYMESIDCMTIVRCHTLCALLQLSANYGRQVYYVKIEEYVPFEKATDITSCTFSWISYKYKIHCMIAKLCIQEINNTYFITLAI